MAATAEAPFGEWRDPCVIVKVGEAGTGKSTDDAYLGCDDSVYLCAHGDGLKVHAGTVGWRLRDDQIRPCYSLTQAQNVAWEIVQAAKANGSRYRTIFIDDLSIMVKHEHAAMESERRYQVWKTDKKTGVEAWTGDYTFKIWVDLAARIETFIEIGRWQGLMHVVINSHERDPENDDKTGVFYKGGSWMPSKKIVKTIPHLATTCARIVKEPGRLPWPGTYDLTHETALLWHTKDRHGFSGKLPLNTAEMLRNAGDGGYYFPRPAVLGWIEEWVGAIAGRLLEGKPEREILRKARDLMLAKGYDQRHIAWAIRDGVDRVAFIRAKRAILDWI